MFHKNRRNRRHVAFREALRKRNICRTVYHLEWYTNLHEYSKNKIHCSCPMCSPKTRSCDGEYTPPVSDLRKIEAMKAEEDIYDVHGRDITEEDDDMYTWRMEMQEHMY